MLVHGRGVGEMYSVVLNKVYDESRSIKCSIEREAYRSEVQSSLQSGSYQNLKEWYDAYSSSSKYSVRKKK